MYIGICRTPDGEIKYCCYSMDAFKVEYGVRTFFEKMAKTTFKDVGTRRDGKPIETWQDQLNDFLDETHFTYEIIDLTSAMATCLDGKVPFERDTT